MQIEMFAVIEQSVSYSTRHKSIISCTIQNQSEEFVLHNLLIFFLYLNDPTRIITSKLNELISGNLLLRKARNQSNIKITVHYTYKDTFKMMDKWCYLLHGRPPPW